MKLSEVFTASHRENPVCYWLRSIFAIAACFFALFAVINLANGTTPAYEELKTVSGSFLKLERTDGDNFRLYVESDGGLTDNYLVSNMLELDAAELSARLTPGEQVCVRYQDNESRSVYELTGEDGPLVTYAQAEAADRENRYWGYGLVAALTAVALGLLVVWALWDRRKRRRAAAAAAEERKRRREEKARIAAQKPVIYEPEERQSVESYIRDAFGPIQQIFHEPPMHDLQVDIAVVPPVGDEDFYKLVTIGMGARRMDVPPELVDRNQAYAEVCVFLPPDWKLLGDDETDTWPFAWLKKVARMPIGERDWVGAGHVFPACLPGTDFAAVMLTWAATRGSNTNRLMLSGGKMINFYQLCPIFRSELDYRNERGSQNLWDRLVAQGVSPIVNPNRDTVCDPDTWFDEEIAPLVWSEGDGEQYLGMDVDDTAREACEAAGCPTDGQGWERLARAYLARYMPEWVTALEFRCDEETFFAASSDAEFLRAFALQFHDFCADPDRIRSLLAESEG